MLLHRPCYYPLLHRLRYGPLATAPLDETQPAHRRKGDATHATLVWRVARQPRHSAPRSALGEQAGSRRDARAGDAGEGAGVGRASRSGTTATHAGRLAGRVAREPAGERRHGPLRADDGPPGTLACGPSAAFANLPTWPRCRSRRRWPGFATSKAAACKPATSTWPPSPTSAAGLSATAGLPSNPLATLCRGNVRTDRRHDRRALSEEEFRRLLATTSNSRRVLCGLAGPARALLYATAASTGLRASELASLTPASFSLSESPTVRCRAAYTKNGQDALLPLPPSLVAPLRAFLADKRADKPVWGKEWPKHAARTIRKDEQDAGVAYETADGFADFHSLRHLFITSLFRVGVHPRTAQVLARHSTIVLTMAIYTKPGNEAVEAVGRLPSCVPACVPVLSDGINRGS